MSLGAAFSYFFFQLLVPLLFAISVVAFVWGYFLNVVSGDNDGELGDKGKTLMLYGLLSMLVTMVIYGILSLIRAQAG